MPLIALSHLSMHHGGPLLFKDVTLDIEKGRKIGIIGQNGTGKSTLLKLIAGELEPTEGQVFRQRGATLAYQRQELRYADGATVIDEMRGVFQEDLQREARLRELEARLAQTTTDRAAHDRLLAEYDRVQHEHHARGAYDIDRTIARTLSGLGLPTPLHNREIAGFSGGERNIVGLARIVLQNPDLMLLDEPSNHLDLDGIEWFIRFIRRTTSAVVMVSHDRHLLDACVNEIWELKGRKITRWAGNYSDFQEQKMVALALQERQYKSQQRLIKRIEFQARRLLDMARAYDDPGQAKRAKVMLKRLEQMDKVESPDRSEARFKARIGKAERHGRIALSVKGYSFGYALPDGGQRPIFSNANLDLEFGERVALVGPNGSGKTTLFKQVLETATWENPTLRLGTSCKIGTYSQLHEEVVGDRAISLIDWIMNATGLMMQTASELLHRFLFRREDLERDISTLSGGEKSRLQLARLVHEQVNFLMLDEPTNHLDIQACEQLEDMLEEYEGTLLIISHDRFFLEKLVDRVVEVRDQQLETFDGTFIEWWQRRQEEASRRGAGALQLHSQREAADVVKQQAVEEHERNKARKREEHRLRKQIKTQEDRITGIEANIEKLSRRVEQAFSDEARHEEALNLSRDLQAANDGLLEAYAAWEVMNDALGDLVEGSVDESEVAR